MKLLAIITTIGVAIIAWHYIAEWLNKLQDKCEQRLQEYKLKRKALREFKKVFGGLPKMTKNGIKLGKHVFKNENELQQYMLCRIVETMKETEEQE